MEGRRRVPDRTGGERVGTSMTVRDIDPGDKSWLRCYSRQRGVSMEEMVRQLIREKRAKTERRPKPSEAFARHFGEQYGIELPVPVRSGHKSTSFSGKGEE